MEVDPVDNVPGIQNMLLELNLNDRDIETALIQLITGYVLAAEDQEHGLERYARVINAIGSAIAHNTTQLLLAAEGEDVDESLHEPETWTTSPKEIVEFMLEQEALLDREFLASSFAQFCMVQELDSWFDLPDAKKG